MLRIFGILLEVTSFQNKSMASFNYWTIRILNRRRLYWILTKNATSTINTTMDDHFLQNYLLVRISLILLALKVFKYHDFHPCDHGLIPVPWSPRMIEISFHVFKNVAISTLRWEWYYIRSIPETNNTLIYRCQFASFCHVNYFPGFTLFHD